MSQLISPQVLADNRVTFRIYAPHASEVALNGDWILHGIGDGGALKKDDQGVWSITKGPFEPDYYVYNFTVDGVHTLDPQNCSVKHSLNTLQNVLLIPGEGIAFADIRSVPHGDVRTVWYDSPAAGSSRSMRIYTPPEYDSSDEAYPVLYLIHGGGNDDRAWSTTGRAGFIMDNLLAEKKVKPMIIVMPNGTMTHPGSTYYRLTGADRTSPAAIKARIDAVSKLHDIFVQDLLETIIPTVEKRYRVLSDRSSRAIAGLSMGGAETLRAGPPNLDKFAYFGVFSMGLQEGEHAGVNPDFEARNTNFFAEPDRTNDLLKKFWIACGDKDHLIADGAHKLSEMLKRHGIKHEFHESEGGHTWINWRRYLRDFSQLLFKE
jgi:enterochelin esterase-like enzyme